MLYSVVTALVPKTISSVAKNNMPIKSMMMVRILTSYDAVTATSKALVEALAGKVDCDDAKRLLDQLTAFVDIALVKLRGIAGCAKISDRRV